jgi:hypothetical protein
MRDGIALARHVNLLFALTSEIRRATNTGETCHFATPLNSGHTATLLPGTRHAPVESVHQVKGDGEGTSVELRMLRNGKVVNSARAHRIELRRKEPQGSPLTQTDRGDVAIRDPLQRHGVLRLCRRQ